MAADGSKPFSNAEQPEIRAINYSSSPIGQPEDLIPCMRVEILREISNYGIGGSYMGKFVATNDGITIFPSAIPHIDIAKQKLQGDPERFQGAGIFFADPGGTMIRYESDTCRDPETGLGKDTPSCPIQGSLILEAVRSQINTIFTFN